MIPSRTWFPGNLQDRAAWFQNFVTNFAPIASTLGFSAGEITAIQSDNEDFQSIAVTTVALDTFASAVRAYRISLTEGDIGDPQPKFPTESFAAPPNDRPAGMFERLDSYVKRIRVAPAYTPEIGELLGIVPGTPASIGEGDLKPVIKAGLSNANYQFMVDVTRLGQPAYKVEIQRQGSPVWTDAAFATNNPCLVTVTPTTPNQPERILVRAVLMKDNQPVGIPSDPTYVTINP